ncbi:hypothetical protein [Actinomadura roseirufa]|uniref:hypothetical protein n=1 Tax=Actinomadura roseirufa TaxID=2094049 RepID=UPI0010413C84|nr:hypothetical protein [Actinomadura roseirufa]
MPAHIRVASRTTICLLAAAMAPAMAACNESSRAGADPPALSKEQARQVLAGFTAGANQAGHSLDRRALAGIEAEPQLAMDTAAFRLRRAIRQRPPLLEFAEPVFYIPRMHGYPHWFAVDTTTGSGEQPVRHALLFTQARAGGPWLLAADPYPGEGALRKVKLDSAGFAEPVRPDAKDLAVSPGGLPAAHAALLTDGPHAQGASVFAEGSKTSQTYEALRQGEQALAKRGITLSSRFSATPYTVYALRTQGGGALVWYVVKQNEAYSSVRRGTLAVSGDLVGLARARVPRNRLDTTVLVQYLAAVPPKGRATVTGMYRKAVSVYGS